MRRFFIFVWVIFIYGYTNAQGIVGGDMRISNLYENLVEVDLRIYTLNSPLDSLRIFWGDGESNLFLSSTASSTCHLFINDYSATHTFDSSGVYNIHLKQGYLAEGITNIENSSTQLFELGDTIILNPSIPYNEGIIFSTLNCSINFSEGIVTHNLGFYEPDADSVVFALVNFPSLGFTYPAFTDTMFIDLTGEFYWDKPIETGNFAIAIRAFQYRSGFFLGTSTRALVIPVDTLNLNINQQIIHPQIFTIYPSPAYNQITLFVHTSNVITSITSTNYLGEKVNLIFNENLLADVSYLPPGIYFTEVITEQGRAVQKWVKM